MLYWDFLVKHFCMFFVPITPFIHSYIYSIRDMFPVLYKLNLGENLSD